MKIILVHSSQFTDQKTPWLYFGSSYLKTKLCERRLSEKRINLQDEIHLQAEVQKIPFLKWIEAQRVVNKDSIFWWMTHIAGRNNAYSNFYLNLCQLFAIKDYLQKKSQQNEILIVIMPRGGTFMGNCFPPQIGLIIGQCVRRIGSHKFSHG